MRPRGETQRRYNEAILSLSGKKSERSEMSPNKISMKKTLETVLRRTACPQTVVQIWNGMIYIRQQKQISNFERVSSYMKRVHNTNTEDVQTELDNAVKDGLIILKKVVGCKGSKVGVEQGGYRLPAPEVEKDDHDWYCFSCHKGGDMALCTTCHRVVHEDCIESVYDSTNFVCDTCKLHKEKFKSVIEENELNELLNFTCARLKEKTRELHRIPHPTEDKERHNLFIYVHMDLCAMEQKVKSVQYETLAEFFVDALQVVHNAVIFYGELTRHSAMAQQMIRDCEYDLAEIEQCRQCYRMSNEKEKNMWFCQPCDPPHELVFAKQKGFPFWPAKVIKKTDDVYDVRFFGGFHQRAYIHKDYVRPTTTTLKQMGLKKTPSLTRALNELNHHQSLVAKQQTGKTDSKPTTNNSKKRKLDSQPTAVHNSSNASVKKTPEVSTSNHCLKSPRPRIHLKQEVPNGNKSNKIHDTRVRKTEKEEIPTKIHATRVKKTEIKEVPLKKRDTRGRKSDPAHVVEPKSDDSLPTRKDWERNPKRRKLKHNNFEGANGISDSSNSGCTPKGGPAEEMNIVSSSCQEVVVTFATAASQTMPYVFPDADEDKSKNECIKEDEKIPCKCADEYGEKFQKLKEKLEEEYKQEKEKALKELAEKLNGDMEAERAKMLKENREQCEKLRAQMEQIQAQTKAQALIAHEARMEKCKEQHEQNISETKKKQWCYNCELEAIYHCCWNTAYCSVECQQAHWHEEHKKTCRRKRN